MGHGTVVPLSPPPCHKPVTNGPRKGRKAARELGFGNPTGGSLLFVANVCSDHRLSSSRITHNWCVCNYGHRPKRMALAKYGGGIVRTSGGHRNCVSHPSNKRTIQIENKF